MEIFFEGIALRPWVLNYAPQLAAIADNKKITDNLRDGLPSPYTLRDAQDWINLILPENIPPRFFAIVFNNQIVGSIGIVSKDNIYRKNFEIGFFMSQNFRGKGIITRAIKAAVSYSFSNFDILRVYAEVFSDNIASRRALEKAGLKLEATIHKNIIKNEVIKDSCIYSVLREDYIKQNIDVRL